jgi:hypothetical protein
MNTHNSHITFTESMTPNNTQIDHIYGLMSRHNNVMLDQHKLILCMSTLHPNYPTMFLNLSYHPLINE